jgi:ubiquinone/menaquinone biosynthesis C-methylase UbiE
LAAEDLFASAVPHYARYRSGYPLDRVADLATQIGLDSTGWVVDIGCGSGQLAIPLAGHAGRVVAIDPVAAMLAHGRAAAQAAGVTNIDWVQGDSSMIADLVGPDGRAATFAASFHWTDRQRAVDALDALLAPGGSIVVIDDDLGDAEQPDWAHAITEIRSGYTGLEPAPGAVEKMPLGHIDLLERSAFSDVRRNTWSWTRQLDLDEVVGLQLTYSFSSPARLGERVNEFCDDVRAALVRSHPDGRFIEPFRVEVLVAARPGRSRPPRR